RRVVRQFQREQGLAVDGKVGPETLTALAAAATTRPPTADATEDPRQSQSSRLVSGAARRTTAVGLPGPAAPQGGVPTTILGAAAAGANTGSATGAFSTGLLPIPDLGQASATPPAAPTPTLAGGLL